MSDNDRPTYDPYKSQPQTLGELAHYARVAAPVHRAERVPCPVGPTMSAVPGLAGLLAYCNAEFGTNLTPEAVQKVRERFCSATGLTTIQADDVLLQDVANALIPKRNTPLSPEATRPTASGPIFSFGDLRRALDTLDLVLQDEEWPEGDARFRQNTVVELLREKGITRALSIALLDDLIARDVFREGKTFHDLQIFVPLGGGPQTDRATPNRYLHTTRDRWYSYLAAVKHSGSTSSPHAAAPPAELPASFLPNEPDEISRIRSLMGRYASANERFGRSTLRLLIVPGPDNLAAVIPTIRPDQPPTMGVPVPPLDGLEIHECIGASVVDGQTGRRNVFLLLVKGGQEADEAAKQFGDLASEAGQLYQTLPPNLAPIHGTNSPRNLWASVLYGWLRGTAWVQQGEGYDYVPLPFAASAELWRRLLWGTTPDGRVQAGKGSQGSSYRQGVLDKEIERINQLHRLAGNCLNAVLALDHLRHCTDGNKHGLDHLVKLRDAVQELPPLPLADDPFCRDNPVETAGIVATSAHVAAFVIAQRTWEAVQLKFLEAESATRIQDEEGNSYTRITSKNVRKTPTDGEWSLEKWREVCRGLERFPAPDQGWFEAALALERNLAVRRLEDKFGVEVIPMQAMTPQEIVENVRLPARSREREDSEIKEPREEGNAVEVRSAAQISPCQQTTHNADFTMVRWFGTEYNFALGVQSSAVRALWQEWERSGLGLHQETIRNAIDAERDNFRMDTAFRNHPAFRTMIKQCGDGRYTLTPPESQTTPATPKSKKAAKRTPKSRRKRD
jgi:hypothetical protein